VALTPLGVVGWVLLLLVLTWLLIGFLVENPWLCTGREYRRLERQCERLTKTAEVSQAAVAAASDALEAARPQYNDRRYLSALHRQTAQVISVEDLQNICFELGIEYDDLSATNLSGRVRELIEYLRARNRVSELVGILTRDRPGIDWARVG
jgi:hypothetical protein